MGKLTVAKVKSLGPGRHMDGKGLMLAVSTTGSRKWILRLQWNGKRHDIGLGGDDVTLDEARDEAQQLRKLARLGENPLEARRKARDGGKTFEEVARLVHKKRSPVWRNAKHGEQWLASMEQHAFQKLGSQSIAKLSAPRIISVLEPIWHSKPATAGRVLQRICTTLDFAYSTGWREQPAPLRAIRLGLGRQPKKPRAEAHFAALSWPDLPDFYADMADRLTLGEVGLNLLRFLILTCARSAEARGARWSEIDMDARTWALPAARMKAFEPHRVPLSDAAMDVLKAMLFYRRGPDSYVFPGHAPGRPISTGTLTVALRRASCSFTCHGFRSTFRDWAEEATSFSSRLAEKALAHRIKDKTEAAYARGDLYEKRRKLMDAWAAYCHSQMIAANVTSLAEAKARA